MENLLGAKLPYSKLTTDNLYY